MALELRCVTVGPYIFWATQKLRTLGDYYILSLTGVPAEVFVCPPGDLGWSMVGFRGILQRRWGRGICIREWKVSFHEVGD